MSTISAQSNEIKIKTLNDQYIERIKKNEYWYYSNEEAQDYLQRPLTKVLEELDLIKYIDHESQFHTRTLAYNECFNQKQMYYTNYTTSQSDQNIFSQIFHLNVNIKMHDAKRKTVNLVHEEDEENKTAYICLTVNLNMRISQIIKMFFMRQSSKGRDKSYTRTETRSKSLNEEDIKEYLNSSFILKAADANYYFIEDRPIIEYEYVSKKVRFDENINLVIMQQDKSFSFNNYDNNIFHYGNTINLNSSNLLEAFEKCSNFIKTEKLKILLWPLPKINQESQNVTNNKGVKFIKYYHSNLNSYLNDNYIKYKSRTRKLYNPINNDFNTMFDYRNIKESKNKKDQLHLKKDEFDSYVFDNNFYKLYDMPKNIPIESNRPCYFNLRNMNNLWIMLIASDLYRDYIFTDAESICTHMPTIKKQKNEEVEAVESSYEKVIKSLNKVYDKFKKSENVNYSKLKSVEIDKYIQEIQQILEKTEAFDVYGNWKPGVLHKPDLFSNLGLLNKIKLLYQKYRSIFVIFSLSEPSINYNQNVYYHELNKGIKGLYNLKFVPYFIKLKIEIAHADFVIDQFESRLYDFNFCIDFDDMFVMDNTSLSSLPLETMMIVSLMLIADDKKQSFKLGTCSIRLYDHLNRLNTNRVDCNLFPFSKSWSLIKCIGNYQGVKLNKDCYDTFNFKTLLGKHSNTQEIDYDKNTNLLENLSMNDWYFNSNIDTSENKISSTNSYSRDKRYSIVDSNTKLNMINNTSQIHRHVAEYNELQCGMLHPYTTKNYEIDYTKINLELNEYFDHDTKSTICTDSNNLCDFELLSGGHLVSEDKDYYSSDDEDEDDNSVQSFRSDVYSVYNVNIEQEKNHLRDGVNLDKLYFDGILNVLKSDGSPTNVSDLSDLIESMDNIAGSLDRVRQQLILKGPINLEFNYQEMLDLINIRFFAIDKTYMLPFYLMLLERMSNQGTLMNARKLMRDEIICSLINKLESFEKKEEIIDFGYYTCLLGYQLADCEMRDWIVVNLVSKLDDFYLNLYMNFLITNLFYEKNHESQLANLLISRAVKNQRLIGKQLYWKLKAYMHINFCKERVGLLLVRYTMLTSTVPTYYDKEYNRIRDILDVRKDDKKANMQLNNYKFIVNDCENVKETKIVEIFFNLASWMVDNDHKPEEEKYKRKIAEMNELHYYLDTLEDKTFSLPCKYQHYFDKVNADKCRILSSKKKPVLINLVNSEIKDKASLLIYKTGDDLRQDLVVLSIYKLMDQLAMKCGLDLKLNPYNVETTGYEEGFIEVVTDSCNFSEVLSRTDGGAINSTSETLLYDYYFRRSKENIKNYEQIMRNFTRSCAGYCILTWITGIADRHPSNMMVKTNGCFFHIDFGHFLGNFKSKFGIKRENSEFFWSPNFDFMMEGKNSVWEKQFNEICNKTLKILRRNGWFLIYTLMNGITVGIPELTSKKDVLWVDERLRLDQDDYVTLDLFKQNMKVAKTDYIRRIDNFIHNVRHYG